MKKFLTFAALLSLTVCHVGCEKSAADRKAEADKKAIQADADADKARVDAEAKKTDAYQKAAEESKNAK